MAFLYSSSDAVTFFAPPKASGAVVGGALTVDPVDAEPSQPGSADRTNATTANELKNQFRYINRIPRKVNLDSNVEPFSRGFACSVTIGTIVRHGF